VRLETENHTLPSSRSGFSLTALWPYPSALVRVVLVRVTIIVTKWHDQTASWRGKSLFGLHFILLIFIMEGSQEGNSSRAGVCSQELMQRP